MKVKQVEPKVRRVLRNYPETRNSDALLYAKVCELENPAVKYMPFLDVMRMRESLGLPLCETVRRTRQKLQAEIPELRATENVRMMRSEQEQEYRAYAVSEVL